MQCASDRAANDPARALRLAGSWNLKCAPFQAHITDDVGHRYSCAALRGALPEPRAAVCPAWHEAAWPPCPTLTPPDIHDPVRYVDVVAARLAAELGAAPEGTRNMTLNRLAFRLARLRFDVDAIHDCLAPTALAIGLTATEITATIRSAVRGAMR